MEDYLGCFDVWCLPHNFKQESISVRLITAIGREAYSLLMNHAYSAKSILLSFNKLKRLLINHFHVTSYEERERARLKKLVRSLNQTIRNSKLQLQIQAFKFNFSEQLRFQLHSHLIFVINDSKLESRSYKFLSALFR